MLPNASSSNSNATNRRYSLFNRVSSVNTNNLTSSPLTTLFGNNNENSAAQNELAERTKKTLLRRGTCPNELMNSGVCFRCQRFEVDLTNTSDDLSATDAELKASRQVISLLQRQLELSRVEKEGLEKLVLSQSNNPLLVEENNADLGVCQVLDSKESITVTELGDSQKLLLKLIQTQLYCKDEEIVKLKSILKQTQNEKEQLQLQLHLLEEDNAKLKSENVVLSENITLRDQTIVSLSNEVFEQGNLNEFNLNHRRSSGIEPIGSQQSLIKAQKHIAKLIDTLDAYKKTNELLSTNVMTLTDRCTQAEKKEIESRSQSQELEAKCCQIQSKLLSLLKEIEQSSKISQREDSEATPTDRTTQEVICSESVKLLIKRLLEDKSLDIPLSWKEGNKSKRDIKEVISSSVSKYECDELGFYIVIEKENAEEKESPIETTCRRRSHSTRKRQPYRENSFQSFLLSTLQEGNEENEHSTSEDDVRQNILRQVSIDATKSDEARWHKEWDEFIKDFDKINLSKSKEFKLLLRSGVPQEYRCKVWKALVALRIGEDRQQYGFDYYQSLVEPNRPQSSKKALNSSWKQIELDLLRTLPNNKHFETLDSSGTVRLRRVLTAYSEHNPKVGYCQGMNRLAAVALLVLPEEEAFWCLATIIDKIMPPGYYNDLWLAQVDSSVVMDFVALKMPELSEHFRKNGVDLSLFAWFLTIFVDGTPPALFLRLWDSFLYEGDKILFRIALALLKICEDQLLQLKNSVAINNYIRSSVNAPLNLDEFFEIAYKEMNPLSAKSLKLKRQHNFHLIKSGFESAGRTFLTPSPTDTYGASRSNKNDDSPFEDSSIISI